MKKLIVYGRAQPYCKFCEQAKNTLNSRNIPFEFIDITKDQEAYDFITEQGLRSVPQLFLDGVWIGNSSAAESVKVIDVVGRMVIKRNGERVPFKASCINNMAEWAVVDSEVQWSAIVMPAMGKLPECVVTTSQIQQALVQSALDLNEPKYNRVAGRLLLGEIRNSTLADDDFVKFYHYMVKRSYWRKMLYTDEQLRTLSNALNFDYDLAYGYPTLRQYIDKVSLRNEQRQILELPQYTFMGIAMSLFEGESLDDVILYYNKAAAQKINIPSPVTSTQRTPSNAGVSCIVTTANDCLQGIEATKHTAFMATAASAGMGVEYDVRSPGDDVRNGYASAGGKLPHYFVLDKIVDEVKQANRGGSATVSFNILDPEIEVLLALKLPRTVPERRIEFLDYNCVMNLSFIKRVINKKQWCCVSKMTNPELHNAFYDCTDNFDELMDAAIDSGEGEVFSALELLVQFLTARQETGRMYSTIIDWMNIHTPFIETIRLSNLCVEIALPTRGYNHITELYQPYNKDQGLTAQCFLSAFDVGRITDDEDYYETAYITLKSLDNLIETMTYPFPQLSDSAKLYRSVGIGITNLAYEIARSGSSYSDGKKLHEIAERHYFFLLKASVQLARERGSFGHIGETKWKDGWSPIDTYNKRIDKIAGTLYKYDWDSLRADVIKCGVRFSTLVAHMPCESSAIFGGSTNGLYPIRSKVIYKDSRTGKIQVFAPEIDVYEYENAWDMDAKVILNMYGIMQKFCDQAISSDTYLDYSKFPNERVPMSYSVKNFIYGVMIGVKTMYYQNSRTGRGSGDEVQAESSCEGCKM